jgi:hypothetical protein
MTWWVQEDSEEGYDLSRTKPKYSVLLEEEDYETEDDLPGFDQGPEENYGECSVETWDPWDPWDPSYFFRIQ